MLPLSSTSNSHRHRNVGVGELRDLLQLAVLVDFEVVFCEPRNEASALRPSRLHPKERAAKWSGSCNSSLVRFSRWWGLRLALSTNAGRSNSSTPTIRNTSRPSGHKALRFYVTTNGMHAISANIPSENMPAKPINGYGLPVFGNSCGAGVGCGLGSRRGSLQAPEAAECSAPLPAESARLASALLQPVATQPAAALPWSAPVHARPPRFAWRPTSDKRTPGRNCRPDRTKLSEPWVVREAFPRTRTRSCRSAAIR